MDPAVMVAIERLVERRRAYRVEAYLWVLRALEYTRQNQRRAGHVTGRELAEGARDYALEEYGPMALDVLHHWGVRCTADIGRMVYDLIEESILRRSEEDSLEDFHEVYDFEQAFVRDYRWR